MARKIVFKENGLSGQGNTPTGYKYVGFTDTFSEKTGSTITDINGFKYTEVEITDMNSLLSSINPVGLTGGVELLPAPGASKYYDVFKVSIETTITTPFQIFSGLDEDSLGFFRIGIYTDAAQMATLTLTPLTSSMSISLKTWTPGLFADIGEISISTPFKNLENKSVQILIPDHDDGNLPAPHTLTGTGSMLVKVWYNEITKGTQL